MISRGQGFHVVACWSYDSAPRPPPSPLPSASCLSFSVFLCVAAAGRSYWGGGGGGRGWAEEPVSQRRESQPGPL